MGEPEDAEHVELVEEYQRQPDECLGKELTNDGNYNAVIGHGKPLLTSIELQLHTK